MLSGILLTGTLNGILFSFALFLKSNKEPRNIFLAFIISFLSLGCILDSFNSLISIDIGYLIWSGIPFLFAPLIFFYLKKSISKPISKRLIFFHLFSLLVFKLFIILVWAFKLFDSDLFIKIGVIINYSLIFYNYLYFYIIFKELKCSSFKKTSSGTKIISYSLGFGLFFFTTLFFMKRILDSICLIEFYQFENFVYVLISSSLSILSIILIVIPSLPKNNIKYKNSNLSSSEIEDLGLKINSILNDTYITKDPTLSINTISKKLGISRHKTSQIINSYFNISFYELINRIRLEEVNNRLLRGEAKNYSIWGIAQDCGFNSKSSFYKAFKERHGIPPKEFLRLYGI